MNEDSLRLQIWIEIMRRDPRDHRAFNGITQGGSLGVLSTPQDCATQATAVFAALFPEYAPTAKKTAKKR